MNEFLFCDNRDSILYDHIRGLMVLHKGEYATIDDPFSYVLFKQKLETEKVRVIISGGGSTGSLFSGFVGEGLADGMAHGEFFSAPTAYSLYALGKEINDKKGLLFLTNNFSGDFLNNDMAIELLGDEGITANAIYCSDDIFSAINEPKENRGGLCGITFLIKIASSAAKRGFSLSEVSAVVEKAHQNLRSVAVTLSDDQRELQFGKGFSGEKPPVSMDYRGLDHLVENAINMLFDDFSISSDYKDKTCFLSINRSRKTSNTEVNAMVYAAQQKLLKKGLLVGDITMGNYFDVFDSPGCIFSILFADSDMLQFIELVNGYDFTI